MEYKYIIRSEDDPFKVIWESFPKNRQIQFKDNSFLIINDIFNQFETKDIIIVPPYQKKMIGSKRNSISTYSSNDIISNFIDEKMETENKGIIMISFNLPINISFDEKKDIKIELGKKIFDPTIFKLGLITEKVQPIRWIGSLGNSKYTSRESINF